MPSAHPVPLAMAATVSSSRAPVARSAFPLRAAASISSTRVHVENHSSCGSSAACSAADSASPYRASPLYSAAVAHCASVRPIPSPRAAKSLVLVSISCAASGSRPRNAANAKAPYGTVRLSVASVTAFASSISQAASLSWPANSCTPARVLRVNGSTVSAPASRASSIWRPVSASQLS